MMAPLRCCSFNCRGWNNGELTLKNFIDSIDLCFLQEHWLLDDYLNDVREISSDFTSVGVSGVNSCDLLCHGRLMAVVQFCIASHCQPVFLL